MSNQGPRLQDDDDWTYDLDGIVPPLGAVVAVAAVVLAVFALGVICGWWAG